MNVREFAIVILRFYGLFLLFQCIGMVEQTIAINLLSPTSDSPSYRRFVILANIFNVALYTIVGIALVWKPKLIADRVAPQKAEAAHLRLTTTNLMFLCFSVAGLLFFVGGLKGLLQDLSTYMSSPDRVAYVAGYGRSGVIASAFETAVGLWLLFGFKRIITGLRRPWLAGRTLGRTTPSDGERDKDRSTV